MTFPSEGRMSGRNPLAETRTDPQQPGRDVSRIPMISAEMYQHVGRFAGALVMSCFEMMGGLPRMALWADGNPTDFYTKIFPKMISRSQQIEHGGSITLDDAISRLENTVDGDFEDVTERQPQQYDL